MIVAALLLSAAAPQVMTYGCHMEECWWFKEKSRVSVLRNRDGELVRYTTLEGSSGHPDDNYPDHYSPRLGVRFKEKTQYVFCSRTRPSIGFRVDDGPYGGAGWIGHLLDLFELYGYNGSSAITYLRACHRLNAARPDIHSVLRRFGYHRGTPSMQIELKSPADLANAAFIARAIRRAQANTN
jgi:hypothetical protein